jgi:hypothetical protein
MHAPRLSCAQRQPPCVRVCLSRASHDAPACVCVCFARIALLLWGRERCLWRLGYTDIFKAVKDTENRAALALLPQVRACVCAACTCVLVCVCMCMCMCMCVYT